MCLGNIQCLEGFFKLLGIHSVYCTVFAVTIIERVLPLVCVGLMWMMHIHCKYVGVKNLSFRVTDGLDQLFDLVKTEHEHVQ